MATDKPNYPSDAAEKFIVRLPPGMREQIAEAAKSNNRSMNAEVVDRLQRTLEKWAPPPDQSTMNRLAEAIMEQQISTLRAQWSADRVRKEALRDRLDRMLESGASVEEIDSAERDLADAIAELDETERMGFDAREKLELIRNGKRHT